MKRCFAVALVVFVGSLAIAQPGYIYTNQDFNTRKVSMVIPVYTIVGQRLWAPVPEAEIEGDTIGVLVYSEGVPCETLKTVYSFTTPTEFEAITPGDDGYIRFNCFVIKDDGSYNWFRVDTAGFWETNPVGGADPVNHDFKLFYPKEYTLRIRKDANGFVSIAWQRLMAFGVEPASGDSVIFLSDVHGWNQDSTQIRTSFDYHALTGIQLNLTDSLWGIGQVKRDNDYFWFDLRYARTDPEGLIYHPDSTTYLFVADESQIPIGSVYDTVGPEKPELSAEVVGDYIKLTWGVDNDVAGVILMKGIDGYPVSPDSGILLHRGAGGNVWMDPSATGYNYYSLWAYDDFGNLSSEPAQASAFVGVEESKLEVITANLEVHPNPVFQKTTIRTSPGAIVEIYDISGRKVETLSGNPIVWDTRGLSSGVYFVHLKTGNHLLSTRKITLIR